jgi:hypothetical protein
MEFLKGLNSEHGTVCIFCSNDTECRLASDALIESKVFLNY